VNWLSTNSVEVKMTLITKSIFSAYLSQVLTQKQARHFKGLVTSVRLASKYKAAVLKEFGKPLEITELERKALKKNEIRVGVYCCGINTVDKHNVFGDKGSKPEVPFVPGFEVEN